MGQSIIEKYSKLNKACSRYPEIVLSGLEERGGYINHNKKAQVHVKATRRAKNGFIEKFCI